MCRRAVGSRRRHIPLRGVVPFAGPVNTVMLKGEQVMVFDPNTLWDCPAGLECGPCRRKIGLLIAVAEAARDAHGALTTYGVITATTPEAAGITAALAALDTEVSDDDPRLADTDREVFRAAATGEGLIPLTPETFRLLAEAAGATHDAFLSEFENITLEQATFVRNLRVEQDYTWRAVAQTCALEWGGDWGSNQIAGMAICEHAAEHFGEDYMEQPWN